MDGRIFRMLPAAVFGTPISDFFNSSDPLPRQLEDSGRSVAGKLPYSRSSSGDVWRRPGRTGKRPFLLGQWQRLSCQTGDTAIHRSGVACLGKTTAEFSG